MAKVFFCDSCEAVYTDTFVDCHVNDSDSNIKPEHKQFCYYCGNPLKETNENSEYFINEDKKIRGTELTLKQMLLWTNVVREKYLKDNPFKDQIKINNRLYIEQRDQAKDDAKWEAFIKVENQKKAEQKKREEENNRVRCPSCGSLQITLLRKRWNILTGFFTNQVDRVCMNCKHKF